MTAVAMAPLRHRLAVAGFEARPFSYGSLSQSPREAAARLRATLERIGAPRVHLVGHSLGGIVLLHLFDRGPEPPQGRVVFLGVPAKGSAAARVLAAGRTTRPLLGRGAAEGLLGDAPAWRGRRELGVVAGDRSFGAGRLLARLPQPNDGTVAVEETEVEGATARLTLPVTHTGLLVSRDVAGATAEFLRTGAFGRMRG
jgi:pimeloyl-ACP methyl ester carboxylesterase